MIVGIHQPNYLPALTYFGKISRCDCFVFLDTVQFTKRNWTNRTRIKSPGGTQMLTVPVFSKGRYHQAVHEVRIADEPGWSRKHLRALQLNYAKSPHYDAYFPQLERILSQEHAFIHELNIQLVRELCDLLGIEARFVRASDLPETDLTGGELLAFITREVGGDVYLSGQGGKKYLSAGELRDCRVQYTRYRDVEYEQQFGEFIGNLSVVDLLFNEGKKAPDIIDRSVAIESDD
jgi:hypothetical protein